MLEVASMALKEVSKEGVKNSFTEVKKKMTPNELLSKAEINGMSGDLSEKIQIEKEVADKKEINEKSNYSKNINDRIRTPQELEVYQEANLEEGKVNDRTVLKDTSIDPDLKDGMGRTNQERMKRGLAPIDENGDSYNLHHIGQNSDSPLAELKNKTHKSNDGILHDKNKPTEVHGKNSEVNWDQERSVHWKTRAEEIKGDQDV